MDTQRSRKYDLRHIMDAIVYVVKTVCQWRMLPHNFPGWKNGLLLLFNLEKTLVSSESRGFDAGKKVKGIKRHVIADSLGLIPAVVIQSASVQHREGAIEVVEKMVECWKKVITIFADGGYRGELIRKVKKRFKISVEIIKRTEEHVFKVLPRRWMVERTMAWLETNRRNAKYYERLNNTGVAMVQLFAIRMNYGEPFLNCC